MENFIVYPKEGASFTIYCERFVVSENRFILYNSRNEESNEGLLRFSEIAAIVHEHQRIGSQEHPQNKAILFYVYLKKRTTPIQIIAHGLKTELDHIIFCGQDKALLGSTRREWNLDKIYLAASEVIAIIPSDGLIIRD